MRTHFSQAVRANLSEGYCTKAQQDHFLLVTKYGDQFITTTNGVTVAIVPSIFLHVSVYFILVTRT